MAANVCGFAMWPNMAQCLRSLWPTWFGKHCAIGHISGGHYNKYGKAAAAKAFVRRRIISIMLGYGFSASIEKPITFMIKPCFVANSAIVLSFGSNELRLDSIDTISKPALSRRFS